MSTQVIPVTDRIWCFRRPSYFACSYVIATKTGPVAVDVGMDSNAADFLEGLKTHRHSTGTSSCDLAHALAQRPFSWRRISAKDVWHARSLLRS